MGKSAPKRASLGSASRSGAGGSSRGKAAGSQRSAAKLPLAGDEPKGLVRQLESQESFDAAPAKKARRRTQAATMQKTLNDNFPGFSDEELYINTVGGETLPERIAADWARKASGEDFPMGKLFWASLREVYRSAASPASRLVVARPSDVPDENLTTGLVVACGSKRNLDPLTTWTETVESLNQKNFVALCRALLKNPPAKSTENMNLTVSVMKMIQRLSMVSEMAAEIEIMKDHWDAACCRSLGSYKAERHSASVWWTDNKEWARLVVPYSEMERALAEEADLAVVAADIRAVVEGSECGRRCLQGAQRHIEHAKISIKITSTVAAFAGQAIDSTFLASQKEALLKGLKADGVDPTLRHAPKEVKAKYRGCDITGVVASPIEFYDFLVETFCRSEAVNAKVLDPLWCEDELVVDSACKAASISPAVVASSAKTRRCLVGHLDDAEATQDNIADAFDSKKSFLGSNDRHWRVERAFWHSLSGEAAKKKVEELVLQCLPTKDVPMPLAESSKRFDDLLSSKVVAYMGVTIKTVVATVRGYVLELVNGRSPVLDRLVQTSHFTQQVRERLSFFCRASVSAGSDAAKELVGAEAARHYLQIVVAKSEKNEVLTFVDVAQPISFSFLLTADEAKQATRIRNAIVAKSGCGGKDFGSSSSSGAASSKGRANKTVVDTKAMVAQLFA